MDMFDSSIIGINIVVGFLMMGILISGPTKSWPELRKFGFFIMALGMIGQAVYNLADITLAAPIWEQFWVLKDIGILLFTISLVYDWINDACQ